MSEKKVIFKFLMNTDLTCSWPDMIKKKNKSRRLASNGKPITASASKKCQLTNHLSSLRMENLYA